MATTIDALLALWGVYLTFCGIATLATGKVFGHGKDIAVKNTPESVRAAAPLLGCGTLVIGLFMSIAMLGGFIPALAFLNPYKWYVLIGGAVVGVAIVAMGYKKLVEKK